jgi:hypothetical protein
MLWRAAVEKLGTVTALDDDGNDEEETEKTDGVADGDEELVVINDVGGTAFACLTTDVETRLMVTPAVGGVADPRQLSTALLMTLGDVTKTVEVTALVRSDDVQASARLVTQEDMAITDAVSSVCGGSTLPRRSKLDLVSDETFALATAAACPKRNAVRTLLLTPRGGDVITHGDDDDVTFDFKVSSAMVPPRELPDVEPSSLLGDGCKQSVF